MSILDSPWLQFFKPLPKGTKLEHDYLIQFSDGIKFETKIFNHTKTGSETGPWEKYADGFRGHTSWEEDELIAGFSNDLNIDRSKIKIIRVSQGWNFVRV